MLRKFFLSMALIICCSMSSAIPPLQQAAQDGDLNRIMALLKTSDANEQNQRMGKLH